MSPTPPEEGIRRTLAQYAQLMDEGRFDEFGDLFEPDARFHVMGETQVGRAAIEEWIAASQRPEPRGKHAMLSSVIDLADDGRTARAWTDYLFVDQQTAGHVRRSLPRRADGERRRALALHAARDRLHRRRAGAGADRCRPHRQGGLPPLGAVPLLRWPGPS